MNRTHDLDKTYVQNIKDNEDYPNVEFVLVNYASKDTMDEWVKNNLEKYIEKGIVKYCKVLDDIPHYDMSHSRNIGIKMCSDGSICNSVDADNFLGKTKDGKSGFASLINRLSEITGDKKAIYIRSKRLAHGRLGMSKEDFLWVGGYPERLKDGSIFEGYGWDDKCVLYRCGALGFKVMWWCDNIDVVRIKTPASTKGTNMKNRRWHQNEKINEKLVDKIMETKEYLMHENFHWGKATVQVNFGEIVSV
jgi:hypothetical protein